MVKNSIENRAPGIVHMTWYRLPFDCLYSLTEVAANLLVTEGFNEAN